MGFFGDDRIKYESPPKGILPLCPHCKTELGRIWVIEKGIINEKRVLLCPHCRVLLGFDSIHHG